jgi:hypothetical protein
MSQIGYVGKSLGLVFLLVLLRRRSSAPAFSGAAEISSDAIRAELPASVEKSGKGYL